MTVSINGVRQIWRERYSGCLWLNRKVLCGDLFHNVYRHWEEHDQPASGNNNHYELMSLWWLKFAGKGSLKPVAAGFYFLPVSHLHIKICKYTVWPSFKISEISLSDNLGWEIQLHLYIFLGFTNAPKM